MPWLVYLCVNSNFKKRNTSLVLVGYLGGNLSKMKKGPRVSAIDSLNAMGENGNSSNNNNNNASPDFPKKKR